MQRIRKGDMVQIIAGKDKGKRGKVLCVFPKKERVIVEGLNLVKRHMRPSRVDQQGGIIEKEAPLHISNVMIVCPSCNKPTRIGVIYVEGKKLRMCKKCKEPMKGDA